MASLSFARPAFERWERPIQASDRRCGVQPGLLAHGPEEKLGESGFLVGFSIGANIEEVRRVAKRSFRFCLRCHEFVPVDLPTLHDPFHPLELANFLKWVPMNGDEVGVSSRLNGSDPIRPSHDLCCQACCGLDRTHRCFAESHSHGELPGVQAVFKDSGIGPKTDWQAGF